MKNYLILNNKAETDLDAKAAVVLEHLTRLLAANGIPATDFKLHIARDVFEQHLGRLGGISQWISWVMATDQISGLWNFNSFILLTTSVGQVNQQFVTRALATDRKVVFFDAASGQFKFVKRIVRLSGSAVDGWEAEL